MQIIFVVCRIWFLIKRLPSVFCTGMSHIVFLLSSLLRKSLSSYAISPRRNQKYPSPDLAIGKVLGKCCSLALCFCHSQTKTKKILVNLSDLFWLSTGGHWPRGRGVFTAWELNEWMTITWGCTCPRRPARILDIYSWIICTVVASERVLKQFVALKITEAILAKLLMIPFQCWSEFSVIHNTREVQTAFCPLRLFFSWLKDRYIKEFVHGDFGRTRPSLGTLLNTTCDILELDVEVSLFCSLDNDAIVQGRTLTWTGLFVPCKGDSFLGRARL